MLENNDSDCGNIQKVFTLAEFNVSLTCGLEYGVPKMLFKAVCVF